MFTKRTHLPKIIFLLSLVLGQRPSRCLSSKHCERERNSTRNRPAIVGNRLAVSSRFDRYIAFVSQALRFRDRLRDSITNRTSGRSDGDDLGNGQPERRMRYIDWIGLTLRIHWRHFQIDSDATRKKCFDLHETFKNIFLCHQFLSQKNSEYSFGILGISTFRPYITQKLIAWRFMYRTWTSGGK